MPDGHADLIFFDSGEVRVAGMHDRVDEPPLPAGTVARGVRLRPEAVASAFRIEAHHLRNRSVDVRDLDDPSVQALHWNNTEIDAWVGRSGLTQLSPPQQFYSTRVQRLAPLPERRACQNGSLSVGSTRLSGSDRRRSSASHDFSDFSHPSATRRVWPKEPNASATPINLISPERCDGSRERRRVN